MNIQTTLSYLLIFSAFIHLIQAFVYGFKEFNRPTILFGVVYLFLGFALPKEQNWIDWAVVLVSITGFIGGISGLSESIKPKWVNYTMLSLNLAIAILGLTHLLS